MDKLKSRGYTFLRSLEKYTKTDMVYLARGGFWLNVNYVIGSLMSFVLSILFARYISKDMYGIYKYILSASGVAAAFSLNGINTAVTRAVAQGFEGTLKRAIIAQLHWIVPQIFITLALALYYFYQGNSFYGISFLIVTVFAPIGSIANTYSAYIQGKKDFRTQSLYGIVQNLVYFIVTALALLYYPNIIMLVASYFVSNAVIHTYFCFRTFRKFKPSTEYREDDINYGKHISVLNMIGMLAAQLDSLVVYHFMGPAALAVYSFATIIPERIRSLFGFITTAALPKIAEREAAGQKVDVTGKTIQLFIISLIISGAYILTAPFIFSIFLPQYMDSVVYSQVFSLSLVAIAANVSISALFAKRSQKELYVFGTLGPIIRIVVLLSAVYYFGLWGAIFAKIFGHLLQVVLSLSLLKLSPFTPSQPTS